MYDPKTRVGGMVHFLLPGNQHSDSSNSKYGVHSMELLINGLMKLGAERNRLMVKVFGGGQISCSNRDIGILNQKFVKSFLMRERIRCLASDLGGPHARKIRFIPASGRVQHMLIPMFETESELISQNPIEEDSNSIELF